MESINRTCIAIVFALTINCFLSGDQEKNGCTENSFILGPSTLDGIGVFAAHDIPAGTLLPDKGHAIRIMKIKDVPAAFLKYCIYINDEECICPERFDRMEIGWFFNHSATPNISYNTTVINDLDISDGSTIPPYSFRALTDIKAGDEILIDYSELNEPEHLRENCKNSLLLQYLLYLDLTGLGSCVMNTDHCLAMKSESSLKTYNRVCNKVGVTIHEIESIKQFFSTIPFTWVVDVQDSHTIDLLERQGLRRVAEFPAMKIDISTVSSRAHEPKLVISEAQLPSEIKLWVEHTAPMYTYDVAALNHALSYLRTAGGEAVKLYLGWHDNEVVCTGMMIYHGQVATLHVIGTVPKYRKQGFGFDFTYQLLKKAAGNGCTEAALLATPAGRLLYSKLGFETYSTYYFYAVV